MVPVVQKDPRAVDKDATVLFSQLRKLDLDRIGLNFLGSSPPELFVGRFNYPRVYTGILAPAGHDERSFRLSAPEEWFRQGLSIDQVLGNRQMMVYSRFTSDVKRPHGSRIQIPRRRRRHPRRRNRQMENQRRRRRQTRPSPRRDRNRQSRR